jgi:hypothetical protein
MAFGLSVYILSPPECGELSEVYISFIVESLVFTIVPSLPVRT